MECGVLKELSTKKEFTMTHNSHQTFKESEAEEKPIASTIVWYMKSRRTCHISRDLKTSPFNSELLCQKVIS